MKKTWLQYNTPEMEEAIEYMKIGGSIFVLFKKFKISNSIKKILIKIRKDAGY